MLSAMTTKSGFCLEVAISGGLTAVTTNTLGCEQSLSCSKVCVEECKTLSKLAEVSAVKL